MKINNIIRKFYKSHYVDSTETVELYALLDLLRNDKWVKKERQLEVIQNYVLKNEATLEKLIQTAVMASVNCDAMAQIVDDSPEKLDNEIKALEIELKNEGKLCE